MTRRHPTQRRLTFAALTGLAAAGVLLPTTAFATPQAPHPGTATTVVSAVQTGHGSARPGVTWVNTTDSPSGITIRLPGKAEVQKFTVPTGAKSINGRLYMVETADNVVAVAVFDLPGAQGRLNDGLQGFLRSYNAGPGDSLTSTSSRKATVDGHPALDAHLATKKNPRTVGATRFISDGTHVVQAVTLGPEAKTKDVDQMHQQLIAGIHMP